jgi:hypothetical protein
MLGPAQPLLFRWGNLVYFLFVSWLIASYWLFAERCHVSSPSPPSPFPSSLPPIPPASAPIFANPFESYPATDPLYPNESVSSTHPRLRHLIAHWLRLSTTHHWRYVPIAGTLLACIRNGRIIPWDSDLDIAVDRVTAESINEMASRKVMFEGLTIEWNSAVNEHQPWEEGEVRLIVNSHRGHNLPGDGLRYDRTGQVVSSQTDSIAFVGPFARLISVVDGRTTHMDVFCVEEFDGRYGEAATEVGPELATFPVKVEPCVLEGEALWCPSKEDYDPILQHAYGKDYMVPQR